MGTSKKGYTMIAVYLPNQLVKDVKARAKADRRTISATFEILVEKGLRK